MAYTNTTLLGLNQPTTGSESGVWGDDINLGTTILVELAVAGTNNITTDADVTLSISNGSSGSSFTSTATNSTVAQYYILNCTGARTANRSIIAPASSKTYYVINSTTTATTPFTITIKKSGGTGVTIPPGAAALVAYNGTDFQAINAITGVLGFSDTNLVMSAQASANTYVQGVIQNTSSGTSASADFIVANNLSTASTYYGDFGINSSTFSGTGSLSAANATYVTATSGDLAIGTTTANGIHFVTNGSATDAMAISSAGVVSIGGSNIVLGGNFTTSGAFATTVAVTAATSVTLPTSGTLGYQNIPQNSQSTAYTTVLADAGKCVFHPASDANARTFTIDSNANVPYALGTVIQFINMSANNVTIAITADTLTWAQGGGSGSRTLAQWGVANVVKIASTQWLLTGTNVT